MRLRWLVPIALLLLAGCGRREPTAREVALQFHDHLSRHARSGYASHRADAFALLSRSAKARLAELAEALNVALPANREPLQPDELLNVRRVHDGDAVEEAVYDGGEGDGGETVVVVLVRASGEDRLVMVREEGNWRVDLFAEPGGGAAAKGAPEPAQSAGPGTRPGAGANIPSVE